MGAPLRDVREGSRVGLALDSRRNLHLYIEGNHLGVVAPDVADPCYVIHIGERYVNMTVDRYSGKLIILLYSVFIHHFF